MRTSKHPVDLVTHAYFFFLFFFFSFTPACKKFFSAFETEKGEQKRLRNRSYLDLNEENSNLCWLLLGLLMEEQTFRFSFLVGLRDQAQSFLPVRLFRTPRVLLDYHC